MRSNFQSRPYAKLQKTEYFAGPSSSVRFMHQPMIYILRLSIPFASFFACTLHWCKHCTVLEVTTNVHKFPLTTLCGITEQGLICRPILVGTLFAPTKGLHFQALHPLSLLFICTLHWCKHCTVLATAANVRKFAMTSLCGIAANGHICRPVFVGTLFCTNQ